MATPVNTANGKWSVSGTTATYKVGSDVVAKITGLASGLKADDLNGGSSPITVTAATGTETVGTITLKDDALGTSAKTALTLSNGGSYKLALDGGDTLVIGTPTLSTSTGKATYTANITTAGYKQTDDKTIIYSTKKNGVVVATVSGLASSVPDGVVSESGGVVTLKLDAFNKKKVTLSSGYGYKLALDTTDAEYTAGTDGATDTLGGKDGTAAWTVSGTTATYKQTRSAKYTLAADGKSVAYTAAKTATLATVKGLKKDIDASTLGTSGITGTTTSPATAYDAGSNLTLDSTVLGTTKTVTLTNGKGLDGTASTYKLALVAAGGTNAPAQSKTDVQLWAVSGTTATYKTVTPAYYEKTNDTTITYTAQKDVAKLATVKGLAKGLKAGTGTNAAKLLDANDAEVATADAYSASLTSASKGAITVNKKALTTTNATITSDVYKLALTTSTTEGEAVTAPTITPTWSVSGTTATLKGKVTAGWELSTDASKITYTKATATGKYATLATVKGLTTGLTNGTIGNAISVSVDANGKVKKDSGVATITLKAAALGTKNITLSGTGYKLALDSTDIYDATNNATGKIIQAKATTTGTAPNTTTTYSAPNGKDVWRLDGTTATYKNVTPAYYTPGDTKITYTAEDAGKTAEQKTAAVIATVTGLKSGLAAADNGIYADATTAATATAANALVAITSEAEKDGSTSEKAITITLKKGALTTENVTLTTGTGKYANLAVYTTAGDQKVDEPSLTGTPKWATEDVAASGSTPASTTVILRSQANEGWTLNSDKQSITYAPASTATDVATITGLKAGLAANETHGIFATAAEAAAATSGTLITLGSTEDTKKQITLTADVVGEQDIAVEGSYGYEFMANTGANVGYSGAAKPTAKDMWVLGSASGTFDGTAEYKSMVAKYFTFDASSGTEDKTKLKYTPAAENSTPSVKAKLTGLAENLEVSGDGQSIKDAAKNTVISLDDNTTPTKITAKSGALNGKDDLKITTGNLIFDTLTPYDASSAPDGIIAPETTYSLEFSNGTATVKEGSSEGYALDTSDSKTIKYQEVVVASSASTAAATITGLKTKLDDDKEISDYITLDTSTKALTIGHDILTDKNVELTTEKTYTLAFTDITAASKAGLSKAGNDWALYSGTGAGYTLDSSGKKKITYAAPAITSTKLATIAGLSSGLSAVDYQVDGINIDGTTIKLSNNVLAASTSIATTLTNEGGNTYVFALDTKPASDAVEGYNYVPSSDAVNTFSIASGTLTYKTTNPAGYALSTDSKTVTYTDEMVDKTTIAGLKSSLNISETEVEVTPDGSNVTLTTGITLTAPVKSTDATVDDTTGTFKIGAKAVGKKDITLTNDVGNSSLVSGDFDYNIALDGVTAQTVNAPVWNKTNKTTTATYTQTFAKGYTQTDDEHIVYASKNTKKTYATLTGLNKDVVANADGTINGITIALDASVTTASAGSNATVVSGDVITLSDPNLFTTTNITLGKTDNYYLAVAEGFGSASAVAHWSLAKGTAKVVTGMTEGWQIKETVKNGTTNYDNKTIEYKKADETSKPAYTLATVTGLNSALELNDDGTIDGLEFDTTNHNITVSEAAVTTGTVTVAGTSYTLVMGDGIGLPEAEEPEWVVNKGTATYQYDVSEGWKFNSTETPTSMTYQAAKTEKTAVVLTTITGLNPALEAAGTDIAIVDDKYELSSDGTEYVGISSIEKGTIELSAKALEGTKTVKFKDKNSVYQFKLADDVYAEGVANTNLTEDQNADEWKDQDGWVTNGTTANYKTGYHKEHYKFGTDGSIAVVAATKGDDVATVKNIKKDSTITDQNGLITLTSANLDGKTVTLTSTVAGYALALDTTGISNGDIVESKYINKKWSPSGNKANLTGTLTKGYQVSADGKTVTYNNTAKSTTLATVTGIKNNVNITDCVDESTGEITLSKAQLDGKAVTLTNTANLGYTLKLGDDVAAPVIDKTSIDWAVKGDTATLNGKVTTAGFTVAPDAQSIAYTAATTGTKVATLATIKGINQSEDIKDTLPTLLAGENSDKTTNVTDIDTCTITLRNELLSDSVTVDGKNLFAFDFEDDYSNKKVTGTTVSDKLTVTGSGVQVEGGKGNDIINFTGSDGGNTLVYASGDGDDVVVNFTDSDIIKSEKSVITGDNIKTEYDSSGVATGNVLVTIGKNTIRLQNYTGSTLTIFDKSGTTTYESQDTNPFWTTPTADSASNVLLADNNYSADAAALSDIVEPFKASYTPYDFEGGLDLVKKDSFAPAITYTGTDKK